MFLEAQQRIKQDYEKLLKEKTVKNLLYEHIGIGSRFFFKQIEVTPNIKPIKAGLHHLPRNRVLTLLNSGNQAWLEGIVRKQWVYLYLWLLISNILYVTYSMLLILLHIMTLIHILYNSDTIALIFLSGGSSTFTTSTTATRAIMSTSSSTFQTTTSITSTTYPDYEYEVSTAENPTTINVKILPKTDFYMRHNFERFFSTTDLPKTTAGSQEKVHSMVHDYTEKKSTQPEISEKVSRSPKVTKPLMAQRRFSLGTRLQEDSPYVINIFNNQVYEQSVTEGARLVNNHHQNIRFTDQAPLENKRIQILQDLWIRHPQLKFFDQISNSTINSASKVLHGIEKIRDFQSQMSLLVAS